MAESDLTPTARSRVGARGIMQLMPSTYGQIKSALPRFGAIDDPEWNIAAGILHDRDLWTLWGKDVPENERWAFMFASYNAGEGTIMRARHAAELARLDHSRWPAIETVAPFGANLHVSARDAAALKAVIESYRHRADLTWTRSEPSLEDVFIDLMTRAKDPLPKDYVQ